MSHNPLAETSFLFWLSKGLPRHQACGLVAQEQAESGYNPKAVGDNHHAFGLFQEHSDRCDAIKRHTGIDILQLPPHEDQLKAAWWELNNTERHALDMIRKSGSAYEAGSNAARYWERPASHNDWDKRGKIAEALLADFNARKVGFVV
jgi:hypothetical protein